MQQYFLCDGDYFYSMCTDMYVNFYRPFSSVYDQFN